MTYVDQVLLESFRLRPAAVTSVLRKCIKTFELGGYQIPKGWIVLPFLADQSHEPDFDPDRFAPGNKAGVELARQLFPYGGGTRTCLGQTYAQYARKLFVLMLVRKWKLSFVDARFNGDDTATHWINWDYFVCYPKSESFVQLTPRLD